MAIRTIKYFIFHQEGNLLEILEARKSLEGTIAALVAERRNDEDLQAMEEALEKMEVNLGDP